MTVGMSIRKGEKANANYVRWMIPWLDIEDATGVVVRFVRSAYKNFCCKSVSIRSVGKGNPNVKIREKLKAEAMPLSEGVMVQDVRIGLGYTAVLLEGGRCGLAYTFHGVETFGCTVFKEMRPLAGRPAGDLLTLLSSRDAIASAVAIATANALINTEAQPYEAGDILDIIELRSTDSVGMIGHFVPLVAKIRGRVSSLSIFEEKTAPVGHDLLPALAVHQILPRCQVALITATALINGTMDDILRAAAGCREVAVLGASTPLLEKIYAATPVTVISGVVPHAPQKVLQVVSEGGGMGIFKRHVRKVNVRIRKEHPFSI